MNSSCISEIGWGCFAEPDKGVVVLILGYFDESGTDGQHGKTVIAGFIGSLQQWMHVRTPWAEELARVHSDLFHYVECKGRNKRYRHLNPGEEIKHIDELAQIAATSGVRNVGASFSGNWERVINLAVNNNPELERDRYPTAYSLCFELLLSAINDAVDMYYPGSPVALFFERSDEFSKRAIEVFDIVKHNNKCGNITSIAYLNDKSIIQLQVADMIAYETRRYLWAKDNRKELISRDSEFRLIRRMMGNNYSDSFGMILDEKGALLALSKPIGRMEYPPGHPKA